MPNQPDPRQGRSQSGQPQQSQRPAASAQSRQPAQQRPVGAAQRAATGGQPQRPSQGQQRASQGGQGGQRRPAGGQQPPKKRRLRSENRWIRAIIMAMCTIAVSIFLAIFVLQSANDLLGFEKEDQEIGVTIPENATLAEVAHILKDSGVIDQSLTFRVFAAFKSSEEDINPGDYVFNSNMGYLEIIAKLESGITYTPTVRLTITEGRTLLEVAQLLEEEGVCEVQEFMDYLNSAEYDYVFFDQLEENPLRFNLLEGYLYPDTYDFYVPETPESVARKFIRNFNDKMTTPMMERIEELGMTIDEVITLASIIQREAGDSDDMRLVSSVFHNRLNSSTYPNLQSDVTILYVENNIKPLLSTDNQDMYDAYNTYVCTGLPVGPICNPGEDAILAALYPDSTYFYFFVTDENGEFYYATNPSDHYNNVNRAMQEGEVHGIDTQ